jgi:1-acyl-sn-glycerol-3-phosphate acyltransferase
MERPDLLSVAPDRLSRMERALIRTVRRTFEPGRIDSAVRWCQRHVGSTWIHLCTNHLLHVHGLDRLPPLDADQSFICVANHRSFFDLYAVTAYLVRRGLPHRIVFPVKSTFFYERPLGLVVNGAASFFAMYPPIFRERKKLIINPASLDEIVWLLRRGGTFLGFHPEGTRKQDDDPYTLLPAQRGVGRVIEESRVPVLPVFVNGLNNDFVQQVRGNFTGAGSQIIIVFGKPIDFDDLLEQAPSKATHQAMANRCLEVVAALGQEEKRLREELTAAATTKG